METSKTFKFDKIPANVEELKAIPEAGLTDAFAVAALTALICCNYENDVQETVNMINFIKGPQPLSNYEIQFLRDRLVGKYYVPRSFFEGTSVQNNYQPSLPYTIVVSDNPYSYGEEGYVNLFLTSTGADSPRPVKMRKKGDQWFLWQNSLLADIRKPAAEDPWA